MPSSASLVVVQAVVLPPRRGQQLHELVLLPKQILSELLLVAVGCSCFRAGSDEPVLLLCPVTVLFVLPVKGTVGAQALERVQEGFFHSQSVSFF